MKYRIRKKPRSGPNFTPEDAARMSTLVMILDHTPIVRVGGAVVQFAAAVAAFKFLSWDHAVWLGALQLIGVQMIMDGIKLFISARYVAAIGRHEPHQLVLRTTSHHPDDDGSLAVQTLIYDKGLPTVIGGEDEDGDGEEDKS